MTNLKVNFAGVEFKNPLALASGTAGYGDILYEMYDLEKLGGISTKGLTLNGSPGNKGNRIWESPAGVMNSIGLENIGVRRYADEIVPYLEDKDIVHIVNLGGNSEYDYLKGIEILNPHKSIDIIELNISCPNVKEGGMSFGVDCDVARDLVRKVRQNTDHKLVIKLSPNARDIVEMAKMCEEEGADGVSLVNTFLGMAIDIYKKEPIFNNIYAGLSGPAVKPIALRMVHQVAQEVKIPIMGLGGISTARDAIEFLLAGATVIQVGTATFMKPDIGLDIIDGIEKYLEEQGIDDVNKIIGIV
ncbi:MAG: dihydroorotate dehydrogenase [Tissierellia bacterium]|nr:dihydroorotate dehydrogenase [Tissierellia bacterium]